MLDFWVWVCCLRAFRVIAFKTGFCCLSIQIIFLTAGSEPFVLATLYYPLHLKHFKPQTTFSNTYKKNYS